MQSFQQFFAMVKRLPSWIFIGLALSLIGLALMPIMRATFGIDAEIQMQFLTVTMLLIAGVMCGLTGMILLARRQPTIEHLNSAPSMDPATRNKAAMLHASGLLVITGLPLANFLLCYVLWVQFRGTSAELDQHGREAICQQITFYLYSLMCLFMALLIIGVFGFLLLLAIHLVCSLIATAMALQGKVFRYPANIAIIDRMMLEPPE